MAKQPGTKINEKALNKGQMRKLTTLRKSLGNEIGDKAFAAWLDQGDGGQGATTVDQNAKLITDVLGELVNAGKLRIPRGGYHLARGRRRVIVTRP